MAFTYQQALEYIHSFDDPYLAALRDHGKQTWGLEGIRQLLDRLGNPHLAYPTIHVAGTKGKGSTSAFIARAFSESGLKTGLYVSPHLQDWRERIQVNGAWIAPGVLARLVEDIRPYADEMPISAFEVTTALAFWHFARQGCDAAVIEVGLGGRLDATSVVQPLVAVITSISLDHTQLLGETLAEIAGEKAAIIKPGVPVVSAPQPPEALSVIEQVAAQRNSRLVLVGRDWQVQPLSLTWDGSEVLIGTGSQRRAYHIGLPGAFQLENAAVALAALHEARQAGLPVRPDGEAASLLKTRWPGRLEVVSRRPLIVLDGAHNPYSVERLVETLGSLSRTDGLASRRVTFVFGCMADKAARAMLAAILPFAQRLVLTRADHPRAASPQELRALVESITAEARTAGADWPGRVAVETASDTAAAVTRALDGLAADDLLCITGSLSIAGEARTALFALVESGCIPGAG